MHSPLFFSITWWVGIGLEIAIAASLLAFDRLEAWRSLFTYCLVDLLFDLAIYFNHNDRWHYYYLYWAAVGVEALLRVWIMQDIFNEFPGAASFRRELHSFTLALGTGLALACWLITAHNIPVGSVRFAVFAMNLDRCVSFAFAGLFVAALISVRILGLAWSRRGALITDGIAVSAAGMLASWLLFSGKASVNRLGHFLLASCSLVTLILWEVAIVRRDEKIELPECFRQSSTEASLSPSA